MGKNGEDTKCANTLMIGTLTNYICIIRQALFECLADVLQMTETPDKEPSLMGAFTDLSSVKTITVELITC